jgi:hypothetical protein
MQGQCPGGKKYYEKNDNKHFFGPVNAYNDIITSAECKC